MNRVTFGLVGYGAWGSHHVRVLADGPHTRLAAIAERSEAGRAAAQAKHPQESVDTGAVGEVLEKVCDHAMSRRIKAKHQQVASLEAELLRRVRAKGGLSRVQLARELKLAPSTAGIYVDRLVRDGFLREGDAAARETAGRPATTLLPHPDGGRFVGVDFEARNLMATVVDFSQQPLRQVHKRIRPADSPAQILAKITQAIDELMAGDSRPVLGIGVGVPGTIDPLRNVAVHYDFIPGWSDVPLGRRLNERFGVPVFLENNIRSMALAELWFGAERGLRNFVCVGIRSGIAAGVVVGGHLLRGAAHRAGEIGRWVCPVPVELAVGNLARRGDPWTGQTAARLEQIASLSAIVAAAERGRQQGAATALAAVEGELAVDDVLAAARQGDAFAVALVRAVARVHGWVAYQLDQLFDPERIIFAGPLADLGDLFLTAVRQTVVDLSAGSRVPAIAGSTLGQYNGALAPPRWPCTNGNHGDESLDLQDSDDRHVRRGGRAATVADRRHAGRPSAAGGRSRLGASAAVAAYRGGAAGHARLLRHNARSDGRQRRRPGGSAAAPGGTTWRWPSVEAASWTAPRRPPCWPPARSRASAASTRAAPRSVPRGCP